MNHIEKMARMITEDPDVMAEDTCPECGSDTGQMGFTNFWCDNLNCRNFNPRVFPQAEPQAQAEPQEQEQEQEPVYHTTFGRLAYLGGLSQKDIDEIEAAGADAPYLLKHKLSTAPGLTRRTP